jgi:ribosome-binding factor A
MLRARPRESFVSKSRYSGTGQTVDPDFARALQEGGRRRERQQRAGHKDQQLCRQVQRALSLALEGDLADLNIAGVLPLAGCSRLLVQVVIPDGASTSQALERLRERAGQLRAQVARSISRKRAPELTFVPAWKETDNDGE